MNNLLCKSHNPTRRDAAGVGRDCGEGPSFCDGKYIREWTIKDKTESVLKDGLRIKFHSLVPADIPVYGWVDDGTFGQLLEAPAATANGRTRR